MLSFHVERLLKSCQLLWGESNLTDTIEIKCHGGCINVSSIVVAAICKPWIKEAMRSEQPNPTRIIIPYLNFQDLTLFFSCLFNTAVIDKASLDQLHCSIPNLSFCFNVDAFMNNAGSTSSEEDDDYEEESFDVNEINCSDLDEVTMKTNFTDQEGRLVCLICYKIFKADHYDSFKNHLATHPELDRKKCPECTYVCKTTAQMSAHSKVHSQKKFSCISCSREFQSDKLLKNHVKSQTCLKSSKQCQICQKVFSDCTRLKYHLKTHTGIKSWTCNICDKSFGEFRSLKEHQLIHENKRQHQCQHCPKSFVQKNHLLYHAATQHGTGGAHKCQNCQKSFPFAFQKKRHENSCQRNIIT